MRYIDLETWPRRQHFEFFGAFDQPHFSLCANVELTCFYPFIKERGYSMHLAIVYVLARAANKVPEFRYRQRGGEVVEHEVVHRAVTIMAENEVFNFCTMDYKEDFTEFAAGAKERITYTQKHPGLATETVDDNLLYMTAIPWVAFTNFKHPMHYQPADSVPRFAWGKFFEDGDALKMPLDVQVHHALMDGLHAGRYYEAVQEYLQHPEDVLGGA